VFNEGFSKLFSLLEKQKDSLFHIRCHTFNTRANRVAIVCSVITKIFNPLQVLGGHISTSLNNTGVLILCLLIIAHCQLHIVRFLFSALFSYSYSTLLFSICIFQ
jgi:hypothetical protein